MKLGRYTLGLLALLSAPPLAAAGDAAESSSQQPAVLRDEAPVDPHTLELARRYFAIWPADEYVDEIWKGATDSAGLDQTADATVRAATEQWLGHVRVRIEPQIRKELPALLEAHALVYAREFSADELRTMIDFAETPAGKHYFQRFMELESEPPVTAAIERLMSSLTPILEDMGRELCAERAALRVAAGDKKAKCALSEQRANG